VSPPGTTRYWFLATETSVAALTFEIGIVVKHNRKNKLFRQNLILKPPFSHYAVLLFTVFKRKKASLIIGIKDTFFITF
jgi:hypothetical protein